MAERPPPELCEILTEPRCRLTRRSTPSKSSDLSGCLGLFGTFKGLFFIRPIMAELPFLRLGSSPKDMVSSPKDMTNSPKDRTNSLKDITNSTILKILVKGIIETNEH